MRCGTVHVPNIFLQDSCKLRARISAQIMHSFQGARLDCASPDLVHGTGIVPVLDIFGEDSETSEQQLHQIHQGALTEATKQLCGTMIGKGSSHAPPSLCGNLKKCPLSVRSQEGAQSTGTGSSTKQPQFINFLYWLSFTTHNSLSNGKGSSIL